MRKLFVGHYRPSDDEFAKLWKDCAFVFDTNVLFHFYRYTPKTRERLFNIIDSFKDRIWLPYQVASEYHERRLDIISQQLKPYTDIEKHLDDLSASLKSTMDKYARHPFIDELQAVINSLNKPIRQAKKKLAEVQKRHPDLLLFDNIQERIADTFEGKVGAPYSTEKMNDVNKQAEDRVKQQIPPGYKDVGKEGAKAYGDVIIWFQIMDYAQECQKPIIFVTDDKKEDWWLQRNGRTLGPRPELIQEINLKTNMFFYMYKPDQFMQYAEELLKLTSSPETIEEVREVSKQAEQDLSTPPLPTDVSTRDELEKESRTTSRNFATIPIGNDVNKLANIIGSIGTGIPMTDLEGVNISKLAEDMNRVYGGLVKPSDLVTALGAPNLLEEMNRTIYLANTNSLSKLLEGQAKLYDSLTKKLLDDANRINFGNIGSPFYRGLGNFGKSDILPNVIDNTDSPDNNQDENDKTDKDDSADLDK